MGHQKPGNSSLMLCLSPGHGALGLPCSSWQPSTSHIKPGHSVLQSLLSHSLLDVPPVLGARGSWNRNLRGKGDGVAQIICALQAFRLTKPNNQRWYVILTLTRTSIDLFMFILLMSKRPYIGVTCLRRSQRKV